MLIMLVENNIDKLRNLQRYVSECYTDSDIMPFSDSSDAMQFIQSERFSVDLCFTAVVMRGVSGFELTAESSITQVTTAEAFIRKRFLFILPEMYRFTATILRAIYGSRTITLNVPDYATDTNRLTVYANIKNSDNQWDSGKEIRFSDGFDISDKQALIINTVNKSPDYTVTVYGGTVDGKTSATKKYLEPFSIAPTVPEGKVFSHWEMEGDNADDITGFEKYAKSPAKLEMPQHDVTFKAVFQEKVSRVDITLPQPWGGDALSNTNATALYTVNGVETTENVDITWRKHIIDKKQDKFDFNTLYDASFSFSDSPAGKFGLADANEFIIYVNGTKLSKENYKYLNHFENGGGVYGTVEDSDPVKQRRVNITYPYQTAKANVLSVESPTIEIPSGTSSEGLKNLLPDSVEITYESIDGDKTSSAPVSWDTASLSGTMFEYFSGRKYDVRKMMLFWQVLLTTSREQSFCIGDAYYPNTVALFYPPDYKGAGFLQYIKAGGWKIMLRFGLRSTAQMLRFEALAEKIKAKHAPEKCWYLYGYATRPEFRNQCCGSRILKPIWC